MTSRRTAWVIGACVVMLLAAAAVGVVLMREVRAEDGTTWNDYRATDRGLVVHKRMRACDTLEELAVTERRNRVEVTVAVESGGFFCAALEEDKTVRIRLDDPLGRRAVLDGACLAGDDPRRRCLREERSSGDREGERDRR
jgi:hypothetical protein